MNPISNIIQCHDKRLDLLDLLDLEPPVNGMKDYIDLAKKAEREISRRKVITCIS